MKGKRYQVRDLFVFVGQLKLVGNLIQIFLVFLDIDKKLSIRKQYQQSRRRTALVFNSSSNNISRWWSLLNLLILSWSSRRTSVSSAPTAASSSFESWRVESASTAHIKGRQ